MSFFTTRWCQGFEEGSAHFIDNKTLCYKCGRVVRFVDEDGTTKVFHPPSEARSFSHLAVHLFNKVFAVVESEVMHPNIYIYDFPWYNQICVLEDTATIEVSAVVFSTSDYLCTTSAVPDYSITLWNYVKQEKLCMTPMGEVIPSSISFSPTNWRHLCITQGSRVHLWTIEQCDDIYLMKDKKLKMPAEDAEVGYTYGEKDASRSVTRASSRHGRIAVDVPKTAMAGLHGEEFDEFEEALDMVPRADCVSHVWNALGDLFIGCLQGQLIKIDIERMTLRVILNPLGEIDNANSPTEDETSVLRLAHGLSQMVLSKAGIYAGGQDGVLRLIHLDDNHVSGVKDVHQMSGTITDLNFNPAFAKLALGSSTGHIEVLSLTEVQEPAKTLVACETGTFVGVDVLAPGVEMVATVRDTNEFQIWNIEDGNMISSIPVLSKCCSLAASPSGPYVVVGTDDGFIFVVDCRRPTEPRIVHRIRLHESAVRHLRFDHEGQVLITAAADGHAIIMSARPSKKFEVLGWTDIVGEVLDLSVEIEESTHVIQVLIVARSDSQNGNKIFYFELTRKILDNPSPNYASKKCDFTPESIKKMNLNYVHSGFGCALVPAPSSPHMFTVDANNRILQKVQLPEEPPKKVGNKASFMAYEKEFASMIHDDPEVRLLLSPDKTWLVTYGADGWLRLLDMNNQSGSVRTVRVHDANKGGVSHVVFSGDSQRVFTCGQDGSIVAVDLNTTPKVERKGRDHFTALRDKLGNVRDQEADSLRRLPDWTPSESAAAAPGTPRADTEHTREDTLVSTPTPTPNSEMTWVKVKDMEAQVEEDKQYADLKRKIRNQIRDVKKVILEMVANNETLPDLEKLDRNEFELDVDEQAKILADTNLEVQKVREVIELENLAKQYIHDVIKKECWDDMKVKGRALRGFLTNLEVNNFPMQTRTPEEMKEIEDATTRRQMEVSDLRDRREYTENLSRTTMTEGDEEVEEEEAKESTALAGGADEPKASLLGGKNELLYSQFELYTREQKVTQITLLRDAIFRIKETFNKEFDDVFQKKEQEVARIKDKNSRIHKILHDLDMMDLAQPDPEFTPAEKPERLLVVDDSEVTVERFLTAEQRKKLEEERLAEEERRRRERADNWRERGLEDMMGGVLEVKKEDELKKDIPKPAFMINKPEEEWSEDERKAVVEYERKVKELSEEREKYKKQLESELKKLSGLIDDGKAQFEETLGNLFNKKIRIQQAIFQEELKILRVKFNLLVEEELDRRGVELKEMIEEKKQEIKEANEKVVEAKKTVEHAQNNYGVMCAEDKILEKNFKKEFSDQSAAVVDLLFRIFKRRPKRNLMGSTGTTALLGEASPYNPYAGRPPTARQATAHRNALEAAIDDLDQDRRDDTDPAVWERLCKSRRNKIFKEHEIKQKALDLAEMNAYMQRRQEDEIRLKGELKNLEESMDQLAEDRHRFFLNLEVQLLLKQGQVEVDACFIHDFVDCLLIHRSVVEELNAKIRALGTAKVQHMIEEKEFKKKFVHIEWELRRMMMEYQDLENKTKDIQAFRITREIQRYLSSQDYDALISSEIQKMEQAIALLQRHHEKIIDTKKDRLKQIKVHKTKRMEDKNDVLVTDLDEMNVCVNERMHISEKEDEDEETGLSAAEKRYKEILQRQKLVDLAKAQAKEVAVLRAEVERLRMRTFPALVQNK